jgi:ent-kaurene oxidase
MPESQLSSKQEIRNLFQGRYTGIGYNSHTMVNTVKIDLTRHISKTLEALQDEMKFAAEHNIGSCEDWTPIPLYPTLLRIVALISGRVFVGLPLSRNEDWIRISINFTIVSFKASQKFGSIPAWKRPFAVPFCEETRAIRKHRAEAVHLLTPIIQQRVSDMKNPSFDRPSDMIQWALENAEGTPERSTDRQADIQLTLSMAAIRMYTPIRNKFLESLLNTIQILPAQL